MTFHPAGLALEAGKVLELCLKVVPAGLGVRDLLVTLLDVVLPTSFELWELRQVTVTLVPDRLNAAGQQQHHLENLGVLVIRS